jgi:serine protease
VCGPQVKVLACSGSGTNAGVIAGVQYTVNQAHSRKRPSVANMSLGGGRSTPVNEAVNGTLSPNPNPNCKFPELFQIP